MVMGQAASALNTLTILQVFQTRLLKSLDEKCPDLVSIKGLFGDAVETFSEKFSEAQKQPKMMTLLAGLTLPFRHIQNENCKTDSRAYPNQRLVHRNGFKRCILSHLYNPSSQAFSEIRIRMSCILLHKVYKYGACPQWDAHFCLFGRLAHHWKTTNTDFSRT